MDLWELVLASHLLCQDHSCFCFCRDSSKVAAGLGASGRFAVVPVVLALSSFRLAPHASCLPWAQLHEMCSSYERPAGQTASGLGSAGTLGTSQHAGLTLEKQEIGIRMCVCVLQGLSWGRCLKTKRRGPRNLVSNKDFASRGSCVRRLINRLGGTIVLVQAAYENAVVFTSCDEACHGNGSRRWPPPSSNSILLGVRVCVLHVNVCLW